MILDKIDKETAIKKIDNSFEYLLKAQELLRKQEITSEEFTLLLGNVERGTKLIISSLSDLEEED